METKRYSTVSKLPQLYPAFTIGGLRHLIFNEESNGFNTCVIRVGRKILIDLDRFETWIENFNSKQMQGN
jgi:hypothetical protein